MLDTLTAVTGTYRRNTVVRTDSCELDGDGNDHHDLASFKIDSDEDDADSPCSESGFGSPADKGGLPSEQTQPSKFDDAGYLDFTKRIDAYGPATFMRFETEGVETHLDRASLSNRSNAYSTRIHYPKSLFAPVEMTGANCSFILTGANCRFQPTWLQCSVQGMRQPTSKKAQILGQRPLLIQWSLCVCSSKKAGVQMESE